MDTKKEEKKEKGEQEKTKCTNCNCWRDFPDDYIGAKGNIVKRCTKCRIKDNKQKQRPEVKEKRNERQREKGYYKTYRAKKREENEEEFLKHNAEIQKKWRDNNKEHLAKWRTKSVNTRLSAIKQQAEKKGYEWSDTMTDEVCSKMMLDNCFYCNLKSDETVNGIDRMDNSIGYTITNCVSCCKRCNFMKTALDSNTFIKRCSHISFIHYNDGELNKNIFIDHKGSLYTSYKYRATKKELAFELTKEDFNTIISNNCFYCHKENNKKHSNGIDRADNTVGYTLINSISCCGECNYMKGALGKEEFIEHCNVIYKNSKNCVLLDLKENLKIVK